MPVILAYCSKKQWSSLVTISPGKVLILEQQLKNMAHNIKNVEELLTDEVFLGWYFRKSQQAVSEWQSLMDEDPDLAGLSREASSLLGMMRFQETPLAKAQLEGSEARLMAAIDMNDRGSAPVKSMFFYRWWAAAAILLLLLSGVFLFQHFNADRQTASAYGQIKRETLPDGSVVLLNANSSIRYASHWDESATREVWLEGEALFHVQKKPNKTRFIVHANNVNVVVTGTRFNLFNRNNRFNILLEEGSVELVTRGQVPLKMLPGDYVEMEAGGRLLKKSANNDQIIAWKDHKFVLENTSLRELASSIEETYGVQVNLAGNLVAEKRLTGILPNDNLDVLLQSLEATQDFIVTRQNNTILIAAK